MKVIGVLAALAQRHRPVLINSGVGFATFAVGDALSQGARPLQPVATTPTPAAAGQQSWQRQLADRWVNHEDATHGLIQQSRQCNTYAT